MKSTKCIETHYDVQEVMFGKGHKWCPQSAVVEYDCGQRPVLGASSLTACDGCGADYVVVGAEGLSMRRAGDEDLHPWHYTDPCY